MDQDRGGPSALPVVEETQRVDEVFIGGLRNSVRRVGDRVLWSGPLPRDGAHEVLRVLGTAGWSGAPRLLSPGPPEELSYIAGLVPPRARVPNYATEPHAVERLGQLIRQFHDLTADAAGQRGSEVICHNDLAPANTVFDPDTYLPKAFIDWDLAAPGSRVADLGHAAWQWFSLGPDADVTAAGQRIALLVDSYGRHVAPAQVISAAVRWKLDTAAGIEAGADKDAWLAALVRAGVPTQCRRAASWTLNHATLLDVSDSTGQYL